LGSTRNWLDLNLKEKKNHFCFKDQSKTHFIF
jgi:hypothetical protein